MRLILTYAIALLAPLVLFGNVPGDSLQQDDFKRTFTKTVERDFAVAPSGKLTLDHRYGDIVYNVWSKPEVRLVITIRVDATDQKQADATFGRIDFEFQADRSSVYAKTLLAAQSGNHLASWWSTTSTASKTNSFEINYEVWAPTGFAFETAHRYGDIRLPDMSSATNISLAYGNLTAANLDDVNRLSISYGDARIEQARSLESKVRYGKLHVGGAILLSLDSRYSEVQLGRIGTLDISGGYDAIAVQSVRTCNNQGNYLDLRVDSVTSIRMGGNYSDVHLGYLAELGNFQLTYGDVHIRSTSLALQNLHFDGSYADLFAQLPKGLAFKLDAQTRYGEIDFPSGLVTSCQVEKSNNSTVQGHFGATPQTSIIVKTSYGDVIIR